MAYDERALVGIGGWLTFFIFTLCLNIAKLMSDALKAWGLLDVFSAKFGISGTAYVAINIVFILLAAASFGYAVWRLNSRQNASTPSIVIAILWIVALPLPVIDSLLGTILLDISAQDAGELLGENVVRPLIYATIWSAYLMRSRRVANTYTPDKPDYHAIF